MFCRNCGNEVQEDWKLCPNCGAALKEENHTTTTNEETKDAGKEMKKGKKKRKKLPLILLAVVVVIIFLAILGDDEEEINKSISKLDLADYVTGDLSELLEDYDGLKFDEDLNAYVDGTNQVAIILDDNNLCAISMRSGENTYLPSFAGVRVGGTSDFTESDLEKYGYEWMDMDGNYYMYGNPDTDAIVRFEETSDDIIYSIAWTAEGYNEFEALRQEEDEVVEEDKMEEIEENIEDEAKNVDEQDSEQQAAIDGAYSAVIGKRFHLIDTERIIEFGTDGQLEYTVSSFGTAFAPYTFTARYENYKDDKYAYIIYLYIEDSEYYFRYFEDGGINLGAISGSGEFDGWYELM